MDAEEEAGLLPATKPDLTGARDPRARVHNQGRGSGV